MATALKSTLRRIPWFLALRAAVFGLAWILLPWWLFLFAALYLYFVPFFQPLRLAVPFLATLVLAGTLPRGAGEAALLGISFLLVLGIKDLVFVNRRAAAEALALFLLLIVSFRFFSAAPGWGNPLGFFAPILPAFAYGALLLDALRYRQGAVPRGEENVREARRAAVVAGIGAFLLLQYAHTLLILPLTAPLQAALWFLAAALLFEFSSAVACRETFAPLFLASSSFLFVVCTVFLLELARWAV